jgi:predicted enzyme related to lactoylglutathione lyase
MITSVGQVPVPVGDYDEALAWFRTLGLELREDRELAPGYRWVSVSPPGRDAPELVLHLSGDRREHREREGVSPLVVFVTDDCRRDHERLSSRGVRFLAGPTKLPWGVQALVEDPYGNRFVLVQRG